MYSIPLPPKTSISPFSLAAQDRKALVFGPASKSRFSSFPPKCKVTHTEVLDLILHLPSNLISTGTCGSLDPKWFNTKTDFLSGSQLKASHGQPNGQSALNRYSQCPYHNVEYISWPRKNTNRLTWQGHASYSALKLPTHVFSQAWSFLQSMMHCPKPMLFTFLHVSKLSLFCGEGFSPQTQISFGQSTHPLGQLTLQGQSEKISRFIDWYYIV